MENKKNEITEQLEKNHEPKTITMAKVVEGLKLIAENRRLSQEELQILLLEHGIDFTLEDVRRLMAQITVKETLLLDGMREGDIIAGASVICNMRDDEFGKNYGDSLFLRVDNDTSIYHFIRKATGDRNYAKRKIENGSIKSLVNKKQDE